MKVIIEYTDGLREEPEDVVNAWATGSWFFLGYKDLSKRWIPAHEIVEVEYKP